MNNIKLNIDQTRRLILNYVQRRHMPVNVPPTATGKRRFRLAVETDPHKLVNYCCGLNYHKNEPLIKLKPDNEYPDWLWTLRLDPKPNSWELEPGTKEYYLRLKDEESGQKILNRLKADKPKKIVNELLLKQKEYLHRLRFAALAHMEDDAGLDKDSTEIDWYRFLGPRINKRDYYLPVNEDRVIYMDKVDKKLVNAASNYHIDLENSFNTQIFGDRIKKRPSNKTEAIYDSRRRHRYAVN